jgi:hypothetical protein
MSRARMRVLVAGLLGVGLACAEGEVSGPDEEEGVSFQLDGQSYALSGDPARDPGQLLNASFAVARADSVGGFAVIGYQRTGDNVGNLIVLQAPREVKTFTCTDNPVPCHQTGGEWHGRYITGVQSLSTATALRYFHLVSGTLTVTQVGPDRLRATFSGVFRADDGKPNHTLTVENGTIDVPYVSDQATDGSLQCLLSLVGVLAGECRS